MSIVNIAAYKFVPLHDLAALRVSILEQAQAQLKGTVLLAYEGINLFLAGQAQPIDAFLSWLRADPRLVDIEAKTSYSEVMPFRKLRVKIKREIIRMDCPTILPYKGRAPTVDAVTLARWLAQGADDTGRELILLDTRNAFEVDAGTFEGALNWGISRFTEFPAAVQAHCAELMGKAVVSFCTGGIRCEKAALYMANCGIENVYQLDGGILRYFEIVGGAGFKGNCFVFDDRIEVDPTLAPRPAAVAPQA
jgi:UPF0176 protein